MIDRNQFVEELKLREQIRKAIKVIRERKSVKAKAKGAYNRVPASLCFLSNYSPRKGGF